MFCNCKNISSQAWVAPECSEMNKNKISMVNNLKNEQIGIKYHRIPFHRRNKDKSKPRKPRGNLMNVHTAGILSERNKENISYPSARDNNYSDASKSFNNVQWPQLKSPSKPKKGHVDYKTELLSTETQTDVFNIAEMYPLWNTREIVSQISEDVSFLRQNRITQGTQTEDISITKENQSESLARLAGMLTLAQIHKTYADVVQQENGRTEQGTKSSTELKTLFKLKGTKRHSIHKHSHRSLEATLQKAEIHNQTEGTLTRSAVVDITEIYLSRNDRNQAGDPQDFKSLLLMLTRQNGGLKVNLLHENQTGLLYILSSPKHMTPEVSSYDISASTRNYFILHSDDCMLNCTTVDQLMYGYSFQEGSQRQIKLYNQSLQTKNIATLTIIDNELQELGCHGLRRTVTSYCQEVNKSEDQRFQQNDNINIECAETAQVNENLPYPYKNTVDADATERELQENDMHPHPEVIATEGLDPIFAFYLAMELWGKNKPRMPYTKMLGPNSLQNKFPGMPCGESTYGEEDECSVPKWLIVPLQKEHQFLLDSVNEEQPNICSVYYESQTCKSSRYIVELQNINFR